VKKPTWLGVLAGAGPRFEHVRRTIRESSLYTVCEEASCPNAGACWSSGTATLLLMGRTCTRACRFCGVTTAAQPPPVDPGEPRQVAAAVRKLGLTHVVLTSVSRDDLRDGGASHLAETIVRLKEIPGLLVEVLAPDFGGAPRAVREVCCARPDVFGNNLETVRRLSESVRDRRAGYDQTLRVLAQVKRESPGIATKSSIMVGLGESPAEVEEALRDLRAVGVDLVTLGQYLRPSHAHLPVHEFIPPEAFAAYERFARSLGFRGVAAGPLIRASYRAGELFASR
jgi:lipoic acid synthetase